MGELKLQGRIVLEYMLKNPDMPALTAARAIYKKNPEVYTSVEAVRSLIRALVGSNGKRSYPDKRIARPKRDQSSHLLPPSEAGSREDFVIPKGVIRLGILSDIHLPYHDEEALKAAIQKLKDEKVNGVLLNGDTIDFYQLSFHEKDPRVRSFAYEIEVFHKFLEYLKQELDCPIYFKIGNHEDRYNRYMRLKAPELLDIPNFDLAEVLQFGKYGVIKIDSLQRIKAGKFTIYHGHEFKGSGGVYPARWLALKSKISSAVGHFHKDSEYHFTDSDGKDYVCHSFGCLCDLSPDYLPENDWTHSCSIITIDHKTGNYVIRKHRIVGGKIY